MAREAGAAGLRDCGRQLRRVPLQPGGFQALLGLGSPPLLGEDGPRSGDLGLGHLGPLCASNRILELPQQARPRGVGRRRAGRGEAVRGCRTANHTSDHALELLGHDPPLCQRRRPGRRLSQLGLVGARCSGDLDGALEVSGRLRLRRDLPQGCDHPLQREVQIASAASHDLSAAAARTCLAAAAAAAVAAPAWAAGLRSRGSRLRASGPLGRQAGAAASRARDAVGGGGEAVGLRLLPLHRRRPVRVDRKLRRRGRGHLRVHELVADWVSDLQLLPRAWPVAGALAFDARQQATQLSCGAMPRPAVVVDHFQELLGVEAITTLAAIARYDGGVQRRPCFLLSPEARQLSEPQQGRLRQAP
mmetsp:Transcript_67056/g.193769  ORF Transcript_67056/g.193769 Transcript_67056/m.193769 type:complete len:361 (+) Transcript_67056:1827-2909(+)